MEEDYRENEETKELGRTVTFLNITLFIVLLIILMVILAPVINHLTSS